ncbi:hypothetical protein [Streptomyces sp. NPDC005423]|uniref:hypothetical protein n=1 Tax=Streptomyces sp. NPDC005423 TaxID=3155343 RepID=UPI0033ABAAB0
MVMLALTGFSTGRGHGSRSHHSSGGGCSNSRQDHDSSSSSSSTSGGSYGSASYGSASSATASSGGGTYRARPTHRSTPTASASGHTARRPLKDGTAVLVHCASADDPYATVEVRNPNGREGLFTVKVAFKDAHGFTMIDTGHQVSVPAKSRTTYRVPVAGAGHVDEIDHCVVDPRAVADR